MAIAQDKRKKLTEWGLSEELITQLEQRNSKDASDAIGAGVDSKEVVEEVVADVEEVVEEGAEVVPEATDSSMEEMTSVLGQAITAIVGVSKQLDEMREELNELKELEAERFARKAVSTPLASLAELLNKSVIGNVEAKIDGRTTLAKDAPEESSPVETRTGIPFVDAMIGNRGKG